MLNNNQNKIRLKEGKKTSQHHLKMCCYLDGGEKVSGREERKL